MTMSSIRSAARTSTSRRSCPAWFGGVAPSPPRVRLRRAGLGGVGLRDAYDRSMARDAELQSLAEQLGAALVASSPVGWGDARATSRLVLSDARVVAARRFSGTSAHSDARRMAAVMGRLRDSGIPVPRADAIEDPFGSVAWLITPWVEGDTGAAWLQSAERARHLAARMGDLAARLATVDGSGLS